MRWNQGRPELERMLEHHELVTTVADRAAALGLIAEAHGHLTCVPDALASDPVRAFEHDYAAAAAAFHAVLVNQGLRAAADPDPDEAVYLAVRAQLAPPLGSVVKPSPLWRIASRAWYSARLAGEV